ncbi:50S ribosomal protein L36 [Candidatus Peribacteria bacterium]|nr:50S ribosomal protein L36 [Candidatus Peribacteria bacterium]
MKVSPSIKFRCVNCRRVRRRRKNYIVCTNPRHKQRQG